MNSVTLQDTKLTAKSVAFLYINNKTSTKEEEIDSIYKSIKNNKNI